MKRKALVTGITGQLGSYLAEILLANGYEVHGMIRRTSNPNTRNIRELLYNPDVMNKTFFLHDGDLSDAGSIQRIIAKVQPDEVYNFAAMAGVGPSFFMPDYAVDTITNGVVRLMESLRSVNPKAKFFQATSSHIFGDTPITPQTELTPLQPISPYGVAKAAAHHFLHHYRKTYGMYCASAILYANASPRYSEGFLLSKIIHSIWRIQDGVQQTLEVGDLSTMMDIGYAKEYAQAAFDMMQLPVGDDYILATGEAHSYQEFLDYAFEVAGLDKDKHVRVNNDLKRPSEVSILVGDSTKARLAFGFDPQVKFKDLIKLMYDTRSQTIYR